MDHHADASPDAARPGQSAWDSKTRGDAQKGRNSVLYYFLLVFPMCLVERMCTATNAEGERRYAGYTAKNNKRRPWVPLHVWDVLRFLAMLIMMGIHHFDDVTHYWSHSHIALGASSAFCAVMSRDKFRRIHASMRFAIPEDEPKVSHEQPWRFRIFRLYDARRCMWSDVSRSTGQTLHLTRSGRCGSSSTLSVHASRRWSRRDSAWPWMRCRFTADLGTVTSPPESTPNLYEMG